ncbi:phage baseplate assembly protein V [Sphingomonas naphthae]|uniref:Phage baseplate assembly protein V n=1 Tax=Sphingomonas naphthae TaxID=1813468 RepID=A0ABY7TFQ5_9SPHN|nr:phage baseplate assembly protein V [Sphingomonas naphthae]WCT72048.1 phage baseplate assembly protein V [Sphingomonas naphthae]
MNAEALNRFLAPIRRRMSGMVARAIVSAISDNKGLQAVQIQVLADEGHDDVERLQQYGFTSVPRPGAEAAVMFVGGLRSHGLVIAVDDRRFRLKGLREGEVALYDDQGQSILLGRDGIRVVTPKPLKISAASVTIETDSVDLGGTGGKSIARVGDPVSGGIITSGSSKVRAL